MNYRIEDFIEQRRVFIRVYTFREDIGDNTRDIILESYEKKLPEHKVKEACENCRN